MSFAEINRTPPKLHNLHPSLVISPDSLRCHPTRMLVLELRCLLGQIHESGGNVWTMLLFGPPCCRLERICNRRRLRDELCLVRVPLQTTTKSCFPQTRKQPHQLDYPRVPWITQTAT